MPLSLIIDADAPDQNGLIDRFESPGTAIDRELVRGDKQLALIVRHVVEDSTGSGRPWVDDYETDDSVTVAIGNPDAAPTGGEFSLEITGAGVQPGPMEWPFTTAQLAEHIYQAGGEGDQYSNVDVTLLDEGVYEIRWQENGEVPLLVDNVNMLTPDSSITSIVVNEGDSGSKAVQILSFRQLPVAVSIPDAPLPDSEVAATIKQAGSGSANKIYEITYTKGSYDGGFSMSYTDIAFTTSTVGIFKPTSTAEEITAALEALTAEGDFAVSKSDNVITIEMRGTQKLSNVPVIAVSNLNLVAPKGVSGIINLNTVSLYRYFYNTEAAEATFTLEVRRARATGEERTTLQRPITLKRNLIDVTTMTPVVLDTSNGYLYPYQETDSNYSFGMSGYAVNVTDNSPTVTLPTAVGRAGKVYVIKNSSLGTVTIATNSSQTIDGSAPGTISPETSITLMSTGANWIII